MSNINLDKYVLAFHKHYKITGNGNIPSKCVYNNICKELNIKNISNNIVNKLFKELNIEKKVITYSEPSQKLLENLKKHNVKYELNNNRIILNSFIGIEEKEEIPIAINDMKLVLIKEIMNSNNIINLKNILKHYYDIINNGDEIAVLISSVEDKSINYDNNNSNSDTNLENLNFSGNELNKKGEDIDNSEELTSINNIDLLQNNYKYLNAKTIIF